MHIKVKSTAQKLNRGEKTDVTRGCHQGASQGGGTFGQVGLGLNA